MDQESPAPQDNALSTPPPTTPSPVGNPDPQAAAEPAAKIQLALVPDTWPGAFGLFKYSKQAVMPNVIAIVVLMLANGIVSVPLELAFKKTGNGIAYIVSSLIAPAITLVFLASVRGRKLPLGEAFSRGLHYFFKMFVLNILISLVLLVSFLLLIIPFFFVLPRLILAPYFLIDKNMGIMEAYKASWAITKGHAGKIWGIIGATLVMMLPFLTIIGIPVAAYLIIMYSAATVILYEYLNKTSPALPSIPAGPNTPAPGTPVSLPPSPIQGDPPQTLPPQPPATTLPPVA